MKALHKAAIIMKIALRFRKAICGAPQQQNPNFFPIGEGFGFFVFFGKQNESLASIEKRPRPYHKKARQTTVRVP